MVTIKRVEIQIALLPLLHGNVEIRGLTLVEPDVLLEVGRDGAKNWEFKPKGEKKASSAGGSAQQIDVRKAKIENGAVTYRDIKGEAHNPCRSRAHSTDQFRARAGTEGHGELQRSAGRNRRRDRS